MAKSNARRVAGLLLAASVALAAGCGGGGGGGDDNDSSDPNNPGNPGPGGSTVGTWDSSKWDDANAVWAD